MKNPVGVSENNMPLKYELKQNYPNPFNPVTRISYSIADDRFVRLKIFDILGKEIRTPVSKKQKAGDYEIIFNAGDLPSGVYFYTMTADIFCETKKMLFLK
jgi:hypothetical protein